MTKKINYEEVVTPQGLLGDVSKNPNLDFLMNIFKIPRIWGVSGFGEWNVGQHSVAVAFLALYWSKFNKYHEAKRDKLVTLALVHDAHEAVIGDILPYFKTDEVRETIDQIQKDITDAFSIQEDNILHNEIKLLDLISFLYEIGESTPRGRNPHKKKLLDQVYKKQKEKVFEFAKEANIEERVVQKFLRSINL